MSISATPIPIVGVGFIVTHHISLNDVYYIPTLDLNLASDNQLFKSGY